MIPLVMSIICKTETMQRDFARAGRQVTSFGKTVKGTSTIVSGLSRQLLAMAGVGGGLYALQRIIKSSTTSFVDFEYGLAKVATMLGSNIDLLPQIRNQIERLSVTYGKSTSDLVAASYDILSAQIPVSKSMGLLESSVKAAKGGFTDVSIVMKAALDVLGAYSLETERTDYVLNVLAKTVERGRTDFQGIAENIGAVASDAAILKVDLEALTATIATLTRAGIPLDKVFTSIRNILAQFRNPSDEAIKAAKELGFTLDSTTISGTGLLKIFEKLSKASNEQLDALMPSMRGFSGFAAGLQHAKEVGRDYQFMMSDVNIVQKNLNIEQATTRSELDKSIQQWEKAKRMLGEEFAPVIKDVSSLMMNFAKSMKAWTHANIATIFEFSDALTNLDELAQMMGLPKFTKNFKELAAEQRRLEQEALNEMVSNEKRRRIEESLGGIHIPTQEEINAMVKEAQKPFTGYEYLTIEPPAFDPKKFEARTKATEEAAQAAYDQAAAYARMYDTIDSRSKESYAARFELIEKEYELYKLKANDIVLVEKLKQERIRQEQRKQALEVGTGEGLFADMKAGVGSALYEIEQELPTIAKMFHDITLEINSGLVDGLNEALWKTKDLEEAMKELSLTIAKMATQMLLQISVGNLMMGAGDFLNLPFMHKGGEVGKAGFQMKAVPASAFTNAPRLHSGLEPDEFPAVLQRGERVYSKGSNKNMESLLVEILGAVQQRQTINAYIIDRRDVVTKERMEGRDGESWTMGHIQRNS